MSKGICSVRPGHVDPLRARHAGQERPEGLIDSRFAQQYADEPVSPQGPISSCALHPSRTCRDRRKRCMQATHRVWTARLAHRDALLKPGRQRDWKMSERNRCSPR